MMIEFVNITKKFKFHFWSKEFVALNDVSFHIGNGDLVGFLGANGAGKTTLIKILMDFSRQDSGAVKFSPELGETLEEIKSNVGYLPERAYLYPYLTGREFLRYVGEIASIPSVELDELILNWTEKLQIAHALDRRISGYSKGMQQRLGFVSVLIHKPKLIVLDEPLSGLDPIGRREFKKILKELNEKGVTIFFSSHVVSDVEEICNKVVFIERGQLIYQGSIDELIMKNTEDLYRVKYFEDEKIIIDHLSEKAKKEKIKELINKNIDILEIEKERPTLEEIIYKIKQ
jgi:ABC-2 type transport system ATP-binding protein